MDQSFQNGVYYSPGKKVLLYFVLSRLLLIIVVFIIIGIGASFLHGFGPLVPIVIVVGILLCLIVFLAGWIKYKSVKFMFDEFSFHVEKGVLSKSEIAIPFKQIQNVNHTQSFMEKIWGIEHVAIQTAGTDESGSSARSEGVLPILDAMLAVSLEKELLQRASGK
jgi:uncharacterized membrane protein YdbT with pleckstrin-like domain